MKPGNLFHCLLNVGFVAGLANAPLFANDKKATLESKAKITKKDKIALASVPHGKIKHSELEEENGKLAWSFDIATRQTREITEVHVCAVTGEIVSVEKETPADEKKEKKKTAK